MPNMFDTRSDVRYIVPFGGITNGSICFSIIVDCFGARIYCCHLFLLHKFATSRSSVVSNGVAGGLSFRAKHDEGTLTHDEKKKSNVRQSGYMLNDR